MSPPERASGGGATTPDAAQAQSRFVRLVQASADGEPVFDAPWQSQAFALAVSAHQAGAFSWAEWASALSRCIARAAGRTDAGPVAGRELIATDSGRYYACWLEALETLLAERGIVDPHALAQRAEQWRAAARSTPHGQPITLPPA